MCDTVQREKRQSMMLWINLNHLKMIIIKYQTDEELTSYNLRGQQSFYIGLELLIVEFISNTIFYLMSNSCNPISIRHGLVINKFVISLLQLITW